MKLYNYNGKPIRASSKDEVLRKCKVVVSTKNLKLVKKVK